MDHHPENTEHKAFAARLNQALDLRNYPSLGKGRIHYIQEIFNISRAGANKWLHGRAIPHKKKRLEIAKQLGVNQHWLETGNGTPTQSDPSIFEAKNLAHSIPLLTLDQAYHYQDHLSNTALETLVVSSEIATSAIAVKNAGEAMFPRFQSQSILIVDTQASISDGDFIIVKTAVLPEALFRQHVVGAAGTYLVAMNPKFEAMKLLPQDTIIGKVVEVRSVL